MPGRLRYDEDEPKPSHVHFYADKYDKAEDGHPTRGVIEQQPHRTPLQGLCQLSVALRQSVAEIPYPVPLCEEIDYIRRVSYFGIHFSPRLRIEIRPARQNL